MALLLNEEQQLLKESAAGFFAEKAPVSALRALRDEKNETGYSQELWQDMIEMGFAGLLIKENYGGLAFGHVGAGIIAEVIGKNLSASPFLASSIAASSLIAVAGSDEQQETLLPSLATGEITATLAVDETGKHNPLATAMTAEEVADGYSLSGLKVFVPEGASADKIIVLARTSGDAGETNGLSLFVVDSKTKGLIVDPVVTVDSRGWAKLTFENVVVGSETLLGEKGAALKPLIHVLDRANIVASSELLGIAQECLDTTVAYLKERKQFGVLIGSFQALQHRAAKLFNEVEVTRSVVLKALQEADSDADISKLASLAKAKASKTAELATNEAIQMHGGIGMTDEFDIGFYIKRARVLEALYGGCNYHTDRFATCSGY